MRLESYAQELEDVICYAILRDVQKGFYIDIGANDPTKFSVTKFFYLRGWHGINIEPLSDKCLLLEQERKRDINLCVGIGAEKGHMVLYERDMMSTFSETTASSQNIQDSVERNILTLADIYRTYCAPTQQVHFCKIDVENYEKEVLQGWVCSFRPWLFCIESTLPGTAIPCYEEWESILTENDYVLALTHGINRYYIDKCKAHLLVNAADAWDFLGNYEIRVLDTRAIKPPQRKKTEETIEKIRNLLKKNNTDSFSTNPKVLLSAIDRISKGGNVVIGDSDEFFQQYQNLLSILRPYDVVGCEKVRIGTPNVGGHVMIDPGEDGVAYSFGCHWHFPFDKALADRGFKVYEYDGKFPNAPGKHPSIFFHPIDPTTRPETKSGYKSLDSIFAENRHTEKTGMILQVNLRPQDGWEFFEYITEEQLCRFEQIVATVYELDKPTRLRVALPIFEKILRTHQCIHFHYHNAVNILCFHKFLVSSGIELTFVCRDNYQFVPSTDEYPTSFDTPVVTAYPDIYIGKFDDITR